MRLCFCERVGDLRTSGCKRVPNSMENTMEDFPLWLKVIIYATIGLTVLYTGWGIVHSMLGA